MDASGKKHGALADKRLGERLALPTCIKSLCSKSGKRPRFGVLPKWAQPKILLFTLILVATVNSYHSYDIVSSFHMVIHWNWPILINSLSILIINGEYIFIYLWIYHIFIYLDIIWKLQKWYKEFMHTLHRYFDILHLLYPFVAFSLFPSVYLCIIFP